MECQEEIIKAIEDNQPDFVKYVSRTDLLKIADYGAVLVLDEPFEPVSADNGYYADIQECTLYLIMKSNNVNAMTEDTVKIESAAIRGNLRALLKIIETNTRNLKFGRGDTYRSTIDSVPVIIGQVSIKGQYNFNIT